jgi:hypothetical protein
VSQSTVSIAPTTAEALVAELRARGFVEGAPPYFSPEVLAIDRGVARAMRCVCGKRGMTFQPYHRGRQYDALAVCPCGHAEPM